MMLGRIFGRLIGT